MSQDSSLYVRIKTKKENLERFLGASLQQAEIDEDWMTWWDSREMHSKSTLDKIPAFEFATNRDVLEYHKNNQQLEGMESWDEETGIWSFSILFFSQNYYAIMPVLAWLKSLASFLEPGDEGNAIIYDFFWGGNSVMADLVFQHQQATLKTTRHTSNVDKKALKAANDALEQAHDILSEKYKDIDY